MAEDPLRLHGPQPRQANHSPLMQAKADANRTGKVANACPFGCRDNELDDFGYCYHLVGFTRPHDADVRPTHYEPMVETPGDLMGRKQIDGRQHLPLRRGDKLVRTTNGDRVYRDVEPPPRPIPAEDYGLTDEELEKATRPSRPAVVTVPPVPPVPPVPAPPPAP